MINATLKVGSQATCPVPASWTSSGSDHPNIAQITVVNGLMTITAIAVGQAWLTLAPAGDFGVQVLVTVTP